MIDLVVLLYVTYVKAFHKYYISTDDNDNNIDDFDVLIKSYKHNI